MIIFGTRPEAIKFAPLINLASQDGRIELLTVFTGQHELPMVQPIFRIFNFDPHVSYNPATFKTQPQFISNLLPRVDTLIKNFNPEWVIIQGDTGSAFIGALAAFHNRVPCIGHVEAGLRTYDFDLPFPEEMNRVLIDIMSTYLFVSTIQAKRNLKKESLSRGVPYFVGNTGVDAVLQIKNKINNYPDYHATLRSSYPLWSMDFENRVLVTMHRRENIQEIGRASCRERVY
jgi:UDP-N-acetylglucosamine 2-epimerase